MRGKMRQRANLGLYLETRSNGRGETISDAYGCVWMVMDGVGEFARIMPPPRLPSPATHNPGHAIHNPPLSS